jgi:hypothetical protein
MERCDAQLIVLKPVEKPQARHRRCCLHARGTMPTRKSSSKPELINTGTDKRYVRRDAKGQFKGSDDQGRSLSSDQRQHATTKSERGQGDRGDR